jgi:hypothetical protein
VEHPGFQGGDPMKFDPGELATLPRRIIIRWGHFFTSVVAWCGQELSRLPPDLNPPEWPVAPEVCKAAEMRHKGAEWRAVYAAVFPAFSSMDKYERTCRTSSLWRNVKAHMKRHGVRCSKPGAK